MEDITEIVGRLCTMLEDAVEENNWDLVGTVAKDLDELYEDLEKKSSNPFGEY